jgi:tRNA G18 (ribose-2'-O)-methylase SpoU
MEHVFVFYQLEKPENVGSIIRNLTTFRQILLYEKQPRQQLVRRAEKVSLSKKYPSNPTKYEYTIQSLQQLLAEYLNTGYDLIVVETEDWLPHEVEVQRIKANTLPNLTTKTIFLFGQEGKGLPTSQFSWRELLDSINSGKVKGRKCSVLTIGKHSQNVATIAARVDTLLRFNDL